MAKSDIDAKRIRQLAKLLEETGLSEIEYSEGTWSVRVARNVGAPAAAPASSADRPAPTAATASESADPVPAGAVTSPMVGTVYLSPEPDAPPYIQAGDKVSQGQTLLLIEAMKTYNEIRAPKAGTVAQILVESGAPVEYGDVLVILD